MGFGRKIYHYSDVVLSQQVGDKVLTPDIAAYKDMVGVFRKRLQRFHMACVGKLVQVYNTRYLFAAYTVDKVRPYKSRPSGDQPVIHRLLLPLCTLAPISLLQVWTPNYHKNMKTIRLYSTSFEFYLGRYERKLRVAGSG
jgi:hypothetical protein